MDIFRLIINIGWYSLVAWTLYCVLYAHDVSFTNGLFLGAAAVLFILDLLRLWN